VLLELRAELAGFGRHERHYRKLALLVAKPELEPLRQQSTHRQAHAVFARIACRAPLNVVSLRLRPLRQLRVEVLNLIAVHLVGKRNVKEQRKSRRYEVAAVADVNIAVNGYSSAVKYEQSG
jgi:hypothetical protein